MKRHTIKEIVSSDGIRRVVIFQKEDGRYSFREEKLLKARAGTQWGPMWNPEPGSYVSEETAERAARASIKWINT